MHLHRTTGSVRLLRDIKFILIGASEATKTLMLNYICEFVFKIKCVFYPLSHKRVNKVISIGLQGVNCSDVLI